VDREAKRGLGVCAGGSYCSFMPGKYFAAEERGVAGKEREREREATLLWHLDSERPQTPTKPPMPL